MATQDLEGEMEMVRNDLRQLRADLAHMKVAIGGGGFGGPVEGFPDVLSAGGNGREGVLLLKNTNDDETVRFSRGRGSLGGGGTYGGLTIKDANEQSRIIFGVGITTDIRLRDQAGETRVHLDGTTGDIKLTGADCAEGFRVSEPVEPGTVLVLETEDTLRPCERAYDKRVAGVVSGAGDLRPGIILDMRRSANRVPVALLGKVFCKVDARHSKIEVGDLLATSATSGYGMKADPTRASGAVFGKAMRGLRRGLGLIPILVSLQ